MEIIPLKCGVHFVGKNRFRPAINHPPLPQPSQNHHHMIFETQDMVAMVTGSYICSDRYKDLKKDYQIRSTSGANFF